MSRKQTSVSATGSSDNVPSTVTVRRLEGEILARIAVDDAAALEFADRLAERGAIAPLERLLAGAFDEYLAAPDRLIRDVQRGGRRRAKKPSRPTAKPAPSQTTTAAPYPTSSTPTLITNNTAPERPAAPHNPPPYTPSAPEPPNTHNPSLFHPDPRTAPPSFEPPDPTHEHDPDSDPWPHEEPPPFEQPY